MASLLPEGKQKFFNNAGAPMAGGLVYTYDAGTVTPRATYTDAAQTTPNPNPIVLDARGEALIFWNGSYKVVLADPLGSIIWTVDNVSELIAEYRTSATGSVITPVGTTAQRDAPPATGYFRFNITLNAFEGYDGGTWKTFISSSEVQNGTYNTAVATGTVDVIVGEYIPDITSLTDGLMLRFVAIGANATSTPTFTPNTGTIGAQTIVKGNNVALAAGDIPGANAVMLVQWNAAIAKWVLLNPYTTTSGKVYSTYRVGQYYNAVNPTAPTTQISVAVNVINYAPMGLAVDMTPAAISFQNIAGLGANVKIGLYSDNGGQPGNLIAALGPVSIAGAGIKDVAYTTLIPAGVYWGAILPDTSGAAAIASNAGTQLAVDKLGLLLVAPGTTWAAGSSALTYTEARSYAAGLPAVATPVAAATFCPCMYFKK